MLVWIAKLFRSLFLLIDKVIYWAVNMVYQLFIMISETGIFTPEDIRTFAGRIYVLLGVFMLFKVSFSLITYILNPDSLTDKSKGVGKLLTNFFVVLIGIVAVPYVFQAAFSLQAIVLKGNVIGNLIMGMNAEVMGNNNYNYVEQGGNLMSYTTLSAFIRLNENVVGQKCSDNPVVGAVDSSGLPLYNSDGTRQAEINSECEAEAGDVMNAEVNNGGTVKDVLVAAYSKNNMYYFTDTDLVNLRADNLEGNEDWIFNYNFIISSIAGGFLAWILLLFCIDVATRSVKLGFLQLIAPIPIISYIDPKSGKDGIFKKWTNQCVKTYVDLFVRLVAIYFAIFVISTLANGRIYNVVTNENQTNIFVIIFIIFGALMFAKQLPGLISDILGVKLDGGFTLNPMKKLGQSPFAAGLVGAAGGLLGGMAANAWAAKQNGLGFGKGLRSTLAGGLSAGFRGGKAGLTSDGKGSVLSSASKGITDSSRARNLRMKGYGAMDKAMDRVTDIAGIKYATGTTSALKSKTNALQQDLANSRRNEQAMSTALNQRISESGNKMAGLLKTFDGEVGSRDAKGNITSYAQKTYSDYIERVARQYAESSGVDWSSLDETARTAIKTNVVTIGQAADESEFNSFNELYEARNAEDIVGRKLEKEINDIQDDMGKFKDRKK